MATRRWFTLIELLIVIAIIAILGSLLIPAMGLARELAHQTICQGNLRHQSMAFIQYADDYEGYAPHQIDVGQTYWMAQTSPYLGGPPAAELNWRLYGGNAWNAGVHHPARVLEVYQCPATFGKGNIWGPASYGPNHFLVGNESTSALASYYWSAVWPMRLSDSRATGHSSDLVLTAESVGYNNIAQQGYNFSQHLYPKLHQQRRNYALADGHVEAIGNPMENPAERRFFFMALRGSRGNEAWGYNTSQGYSKPYSPWLKAIWN